jgi:hypothetical protein
MQRAIRFARIFTSSYRRNIKKRQQVNGREFVQLLSYVFPRLCQHELLSHWALVSTHLHPPACGQGRTQGKRPRRVIWVEWQ